MKPILCLLLCLALLLPGGAAAAAEAGTLYYASAPLPVYSGPGAGYEAIASLARGQVVVAAGEAREGYLPILMAEGGPAYALAALLKPYPGGGEENPPVERFYATRGLNVRSGPGLGYGVVYVLREGELVLRVGTEGKWAKLLMPDGSIAYASANYLESYEEEADALSAIPSIADVYYAAQRDLNVRTGPGSGYDVVKVLKAGDIVTKAGLAGAWMEILLDDSGATGYASAAYLRPVEGLKVMIALAEVNVRSGPGTSYGVLKLLRAGEALVSIGQVDSWQKVLMEDNSVAYVLSDFLGLYGGEDGLSVSTDCYKATTPLNIRSGPGTGYSIIGSLALGEVVTSCGESGNWTRIKTESGIAAYVFTKYLSPAEPSAIEVLTVTTECASILANQQKLEKGQGAQAGGNG